MSAAPRPAATPAQRMAASPATQPGRSPGRAAFFEASSSDQLRIHLNDLSIGEQSLDVDGFKPSLLSRLLDLFAPVHKR